MFGVVLFYVCCIVCFACFVRFVFVVVFDLLHVVPLFFASFRFALAFVFVSLVFLRVRACACARIVRGRALFYPASSFIV